MHRPSGEVGGENIYKLLIVPLLLAIGLLAVSAQASSVVGRVAISANVTDLRVSNVGGGGRNSGDSQSLILRLWNHAKSDIPIGNGIVLCSLLGRGGSFGSGIWYCWGTFTIGSRTHRGKLIVAGPVRHTYHEDLPVIGGTGIYVGSGGILHVRPGSTPRELSLVFDLVD